MANNVMKNLEAAAQIVLASPNLVSNEQRHSAEAIFLDFRQTKAPYQLCRDILETCQVDYVLFESAGLIKTALIREWNLLSNDDLLSLRQYLWQYVVNKPTLAPFVRERILQVVAIMVKRKSIDDLGNDCKVILDEIESLIINADLQRQMLGCSMISALMQEYVITLKSSDIGLTWAVHFEAKKQFETTQLKRIFKFSTSALAELTKNTIAESQLILIKQLLAIVERVLVWGNLQNNHLSRGLIEMFSVVFDSEGSPSLRLDSQWQDVILDPQLLQLFFSLYWKIRMNPQVGHHARNCLIQLASLNGKIVESRALRRTYLNNYMEGLLKLLSSINIIDHESIAIANMIRKLMIFFRPTRGSLAPEILHSFVDHMTKLTCTFAEGAAHEDSQCADDCPFTEAFECMLENWSSLLSDERVLPLEFCQQSAIQIFNIYVKSHLAPPDGVRQASTSDEEEVTDTEESDRDKYKKQLQVVGFIGRKVLDHSLPLLAQLLESRVTYLREELNRCVTQSKGNTTGSASINALYEDLHWLVLVATHVLCMDSYGECALVPSEIMQHSMKQAQGSIDVNLTLQVFASPQQDLNVSPESLDHVVRLITAVFRLCEIEKLAIGAQMTHLLSPELSNTLVWFLQRWSTSYLLPMEENYKEMSTTMIQAFGHDSAGAQWVVDYLLDKVLLNIEAFQSEQGVIKEVIHLLLNLVGFGYSAKAAYVLKSKQLEILIDAVTKKKFSFSQVAVRGSMCAIVLIGARLEMNNSSEQYWQLTIQPLKDCLEGIICHRDFSRICHNEEVKIQLIDVIECFIGVAQGVRKQSTKTIMRYMNPVLNHMPHLLSVYYNYPQLVQLIIELFCECMKNMIYDEYVSENKGVYQSCLRTIQVYTRCNINRVTVDATAEENSFQDIFLLMQLLIEMLHTAPLRQPGGKDDDEASKISIEQNISSGYLSTFLPVDICLYSFNYILPLMTVELLKFPSLCQQYFKLIKFVCENYPSRVLEISPDLFRQLMASVELGFSSFGSTIVSLCCNIIHCLSKNIAKGIKRGKPRSELIAPFLNILINFTISSHINVAAIDLGVALYYLICCYHDEYKKLVENLIATQSDAQIAQRLTNAFHNLTKDIQFTVERSDELKFNDNFEKHLVTVQGFLVVK